MNYVIRLVSYTDDQPERKIDRLEFIGLKGQRYTFVTDYDEVKGQTAAEAYRMSGLVLNGNQHLSAVIFPTPEKLVPLNARGLLQIVDEIESGATFQKPFLVQNRLSPQTYKMLSSTERYTYEFDNFKENFREYCIAANEFKCDGPFPAADVLGRINNDWSPLGFAGHSNSIDTCSNTSRADTCAIRDWDAVLKLYGDKIGDRVFLVENKAISQLSGRILIDFTEPEHQLIPFIEKLP